MKTRTGTLLVFFMAAALLAGPVGAITSAWITDGDGYWTNSINWNNGVPNNPGDVAYFTNAITVARNITIDTDVTVGTIRIGTSGYAFKLNNGSGKVIMDSGNVSSRAVLQQVGGQQNYGPKSIVMNSDLEINNNGGGYFNLTGTAFTGTRDIYFNANGATGTPYMGGTQSTYFGNTYFCAGTAMLTSDFFGATTNGMRIVTITNNAVYRMNQSSVSVATNRLFVIGVGGAKLDLNNFTLTFPGNGQLTGATTFTVSRMNNRGTFALGGTNDTFTGQMVVDLGTTFRLNTNGCINAAPVINVANAESIFNVTNKPSGYTIPPGQVVAGIGTNQGVFKVSSPTAKLHPGTYSLPGPSTAPGIMTVDGSLSFEGGGVYAWELKQLKDDTTANPGITTFSTINVVNGTAALNGGKLEIGYLGGISPASTGTGYWKSNHVWTVLSAPVPPTGTLAVKDGIFPGAFFKTQVSGNTLQLVYTYGMNGTVVRIY